MFYVCYYWFTEKIPYFKMDCHQLSYFSSTLRSNYTINPSRRYSTPSRSTALICAEEPTRLSTFWKALHGSQYIFSLYKASLFWLTEPATWSVARWGLMCSGEPFYWSLCKYIRVFSILNPQLLVESVFSFQLQKYI